MQHRLRKLCASKICAAAALLCLLFSGCIDFDGRTVDPVVPTPNTVQPLWIVFVEDMLGRTPENSKVTANVPYLKSLEAAGHRYAVLDKTDPGVEKYADQLKKGPPVCVVMNPDGKLRGWGRTPTDTEAMNKILKRYGGAK